MVLGYILASLASIALAALSGLATFFNPVTLLFMNIAAPAVSLLGRQPRIHGFSAASPAMLISILWPLTIVPLYWINYGLLRWNTWGYVALFLGLGIFISFCVLFQMSYRKSS